MYRSQILFTLASIVAVGVALIAISSAEARHRRGGGSCGNEGGCGSSGGYASFGAAASHGGGGSFGRLFSRRHGSCRHRGFGSEGSHGGYRDCRSTTQCGESVATYESIHCGDAVSESDTVEYQTNYGADEHDSAVADQADADQPPTSAGAVQEYNATTDTPAATADSSTAPAADNNSAAQMTAPPVDQSDASAIPPTPQSTAPSPPSAATSSDIQTQADAVTGEAATLVEEKSTPQ